MYICALQTIHMARIAFSVFILLLLKSMSAAEFPIKILGREAGLEKANYISMMQDREGFLWLSTQTGLYQYSGSYTKKYVPGEEWGEELQAEFFYKAVEDPSGILWLATRNGLYSLSNNRKQINRYRHEPDNPNSIPNNRIFDLNLINDSLMLLACDRSGIVVFNIQTKKARSLQSKLSQQGPNTQNIWIRQYLKFNDTLVYIRTAQGFFAFNPANNSLTGLEYTLPFIDSISGFSNLFIDKQNAIWFTDQFGYTYRYSTNGSLKKVDDKRLKQTVLLNAVNIFDFDDKHILISTPERHFLINKFMLSVDELTFRNYHDIPLTGNMITSFIRLRDNNVFVSFRNGLLGQLITNSPFRFTALKTAADEPINVSFILDDNEFGKRYLSNYHDSSFYVVDLNSKKTSKILKKSQGRISANRILMDKSGRIWACQNTGVVEINRKNQQLTYYSPSTPASTLFEIEEIRPGVFVVGSFNQGLFLFEPERMIFDRFPETNGWINTQIFSLKYDPNHDVLWIGTVRNGLFRYDVEKKEFKRFMPDPLNPKSIGGDWIRSFAIGPDGYLWMTADPGGLSRYDNQAPEGKEFETYSIKDGLPSNHISGLGFDASGRLWLTSLNGLASIDVATMSVKRWEVEYGVYDNGFHYANLSINTKNEILIGTERGYFSFFPDSLEINSTPPTVVLTDITVLDKKQRRIETLLDNQVLRLKHNENYFSLEFAIVNFIESQRNTVYYILEGDQINWQTMRQSGKIYFSKLNPGKYVFRLKARNADGIWSSNEISIPLIISPPFWKTYWFLFIILALAVGAAYLVFKLKLDQLLRESQLENEKQVLKSEMEVKLASLEMKALRAQMNPHFIFNCLNSINRFIIINDNDTASEYLTKFSRLIRLVLDNSRVEQISLERELETLLLYIEMEKIRFVDKLNYSIIVAEQISPSQVLIQPMLIQPYVENAIWHGLMHRKEGGLLEISIKKDADQLYISIKDNGIGRKKSMALKTRINLSNSSHGMKVTAERLAILNNKLKTNAKVVVTDLTDENDQPSGTLVELWLPYELNYTAQPKDL